MLYRNQQWNASKTYKFLEFKFLEFVPSSKGTRILFKYCYSCSSLSLDRFINIEHLLLLNNSTKMTFNNKWSTISQCFWYICYYAYTCAVLSHARYHWSPLSDKRASLWDLFKHMFALICNIQMKLKLSIESNYSIYIFFRANIHMNVGTLHGS